MDELQHFMEASGRKLFGRVGKSGSMAREVDARLKRDGGVGTPRGVRLLDVHGAKATAERMRGRGSVVPGSAADQFRGGRGGPDAR